MGKKKSEDKTAMSIWVSIDDKKHFDRLSEKMNTTKGDLFHELIEGHKQKNKGEKISPDKKQD